MSAPASSGVDVAIVAYRGWELTHSCLEHLRAQTIPHGIVICDNGCDEGTSARLARAYPEVRVLRMERNMPYAVACNAAVAAGQAEIVVMMNNDVDAPPDFLKRLTAPFAGRPRLGSVGSLLLRPGEREIDSAGLVADRTLAGFPRFHGLPPSTALDGQGHSGALPGQGHGESLAFNASPALRLGLAGPSGTAAAYRRAAWEQVGGLDEAIFAYLEDLDLALRLGAAGWETMMALDAVAVHVGSATFGHRSAEQRRKIGHARGYLLRRYGILRSRAAARALATEALVVAGDAVLAHDLQALAGRLEGWRAAAGQPALPGPPARAIDTRIGFLESLRLRRGVYMGRRRSVA
ncbi:MAG TPA: glycosyltransferase [Solirubrobacteraceae bacterium]|nr:glycosyltransferase [Solirubrobacteraceae bacterium]